MIGRRWLSFRNATLTAIKLPGGNAKIPENSD